MKQIIYLDKETACLREEKPKLEFRRGTCRAIPWESVYPGEIDTTKPVIVVHNYVDKKKLRDMMVLVGGLF